MRSADWQSAPLSAPSVLDGTRRATASSRGRESGLGHTEHTQRQASKQFESSGLVSTTATQQPRILRPASAAVEFPSEPVRFVAAAAVAVPVGLAGDSMPTVDGLAERNHPRFSSRCP